MRDFWRPRVSLATVVAAVSTLLTPGTACMGFNASNNLAVYWGQNSYGLAEGPLAQQPLAKYCANTNIDIIPLAFLIQITSGTGGIPVINFANSGNNCTVFPGTSLLQCPSIAEDIKTCQQKYGKTILLSIGGATYSEGGFASAQEAQAAARLIWQTFGPSSVSSPRILQDANSFRAVATSVPLPTSQQTPVQSSGASLSLSSATFQSTRITFTRSKNALDQFTTMTTSVKIATPTLLSTTAIRKHNASSTALGYGSAGTRQSMALNTTATLKAQTLSFEDTHPKRQSQVLRPFLDAVIDGFDLDLESASTNFQPFALQLKALMDADTSKNYYLTAAPQCPYPDLAVDSLLNGGVPFDAVFVQFYNNYCGLQSFIPGASVQNNFNFGTWNDWAINMSANKAVKIFLGVPAGPSAAGSGFTKLAGLKPIIQYAKKFEAFGGVMVWDASQAYSRIGFLRGIKNTMNRPAPQARRVRWAPAEDDSA